MIHFSPWAVLRIQLGNFKWKPVDDSEHSKLHPFCLHRGISSFDSNWKLQSLNPTWMDFFLAFQLPTKEVEIILIEFSNRTDADSELAATTAQSPLTIHELKTNYSYWGFFPWLRDSHLLYMDRWINKPFGVPSQFWYLLFFQKFPNSSKLAKLKWFCSRSKWLRSARMCDIQWGARNVRCKINK